MSRYVATAVSVRRHREVEEVLARYQRQHAVGCRTVWGNLPPAEVWQLRRPARMPCPRALDTAAAPDGMVTAAR